MKIPSSTNYIHRSLRRFALLLVLFLLACFGLSRQARAVVPAPDGDYPGGNTAEGDNALFNLDISQGANNTAVGFNALFGDTTGSNNTASGFQALFSNSTGPTEHNSIRTVSLSILMANLILWTFPRSKSFLQNDGTP